MRSNQGHLQSVSQIAEHGYGGSFEDYYPESASGKMERDADHIGTPYYGRNVVWLGDEGRMIRADPQYLQHIFGNIFEADKLASIVEGIEQAEDRVYFIAPYGTASRIGIQEVIESVQYFDDEGLDEPYTTGNADLDAYLLDPEGWLESETAEEPGDEYYEEIRQEMQQAKLDAVESGSGDLGSWAVTIRDGNHRAFGALLSGERYVYVILADTQYVDLVEGEKKGTLTDEQAELMEMLE